MLDSLDRGRQAFAQRAWTEAYARLSAADADAPLEGRDLEMMATAAYLIGNDEGSETAWTRAYPIGAAFYEMAEIYRMQGQFGDAEEAYRQAHLYGGLPMGHCPGRG